MKKTGVGLLLVIILICGFVYFNDESKETKTRDPEKYNQYKDEVSGYQINYPKQMKVDDTLSAIKTVIRDEEMQIEIYYDYFKDKGTTQSYTGYSNKFIENKKDHNVELDTTIKVDESDTHLLKWSRDKLSKVENDRNYYVSAEIIKNDHEAYTILMKSTKPIENEMEIINSFETFVKKGTAKIDKEFKITDKNRNEETERLFNDYFVNSNQLKWGVYSEKPVDVEWDILRQLESKVDYKFQFIIRYQSLNTGFPLEAMKIAYNEKRYVELTMQTMFYGQDNSSVIYDILQGKHDEYFTQYAKDVKSFGHPILFRLNNEMNGDWCVYSSFYSSKDTDLYTAVWKHIYQIFEENGVDNMLWVWNPNDADLPPFKWNHYLNYYPGDEYVDIVGLTGYNTGTYYPGEVWEEFDEIYDSVYEEYVTLFEKPLMITEFGSNSVGGDKVKWVESMFNHIKNYPRLRVAIWWSHTDYDNNQNPARIYTMDENEELIETFKTGFHSFE